MRTDIASDETGSVLPLIVGYATLALAVVLLCVNATSLFLAQKRIDALADAAALAASDGFDIVVAGDQVTLQLDPDAARSQAEEVIAVSPVEAELAALDAVGGSTARATVASTWEPFLLAVFVPDGVALTATGTSRAALAG
ncbi:pilus assembly protein TadG-related protein [Microbacterium karelineae]|uniref:pilus assembly protein TadG-related protein n=1 Tax=Microbacterium karelineae TaxID=2654283 RepID=UPI0012EAE607|nr:pilus assembly protein TadG-related protein [Microbacterium karelineae]